MNSGKHEKDRLNLRDLPSVPSCISCFHVFLSKEMSYGGGIFWIG
jgi:hypothetical protein